MCIPSTPRTQPRLLPLLVVTSFILVPACADGPTSGPTAPSITAEHDVPLFSDPSSQATHTAVSSGSWTDPATWEGGNVPDPFTETMVVLVPEGITVEVLSDQQVVTDGGTLHVAGRLHIILGELDMARGEAADPRLFVSGYLWNVGGLLRLGFWSESTVQAGGTLHNFGGTLEAWARSELLIQPDGRFINDGHLQMRAGAQIVSRGELRNVGTAHLGSLFSPATNSIFRAEITNRDGGLLINEASGEFEVDGALRNASQAWEAPARLENHGQIVLGPSTSGARPLVINGGGGDAVFRNSGLIESAADLTNNAGNGRFENQAGGVIIVKQRLNNVAGVFENQAGGTIQVMGRLRNEALLETAGAIENEGEIDNEVGELRILCGGSLTGSGSFTGNAPVDWCDTEPPQLHLPGDMVLEAAGPDGAVATFEVTATDNLDPDPDLDCTHVSGTVFPLGQTVVTCTATDFSGNEASGSFRITVVDTTPPVLQLLGDPEVEVVQGNAYEDAGATAWDLVDGDLTDQIQVNNPVDPAVPGTYTVTYDVSDSHGNAAPTLARAVTVIALAEAAEDLVDEVENLDAAPGVKSALSALAGSLATLLVLDGEASEAAALPLLDQFVARVERFRGDGLLGDGDAERLLIQAQQIRNGLEE